MLTPPLREANWDVTSYSTSRSFPVTMPKAFLSLGPAPERGCGMTGFQWKGFASGSDSGNAWLCWLSLTLGKGAALGGKGLCCQQSLEQKTARQSRKTAPMSSCFHWPGCSAALLHPSSTSLLPALIYLQALGCQLLMPFAASLQLLSLDLASLCLGMSTAQPLLLQDPMGCLL